MTPRATRIVRDFYARLVVVLDRVRIMTTEKLLPTKEALAYTGVTRRYLYTIAKPAVHGLGNQQSQWRIADLDAYLMKKQGGES